MVVTAKPTGQYTYADYAAKPDDERWELIDGVFYQMAPSPSLNHQTVSGNLFVLLHNHIRPRRLGLLHYAPADVILSDQTVVQPDLLYVSAARSHITAGCSCEGPPDLVVEILSPSNSRHDLEIKRELYARHSVAEYLIVDRDRETVRALTGLGIVGRVGKYAEDTVYRAGDTITLATMPGLTISMADLFAPQV